MVKGLATLALVLVSLASVADAAGLKANFEVRVYVDKYAYNEWNEKLLQPLGKDKQITDFVKALFYRVTAMFRKIGKDVNVIIADVVINKKWTTDWRGYDYGDVFILWIGSGGFVY